MGPSLPAPVPFCSLSFCSLYESMCTNLISCAACHPDCNQGMMRCIGTGADQCCNWYYNDQCVINCPGELVGDSTSFECGKHTFIPSPSLLPSPSSSLFSSLPFFSLSHFLPLPFTFTLLPSPLLFFFSLSFSFSLLLDA